MIGATRDFEQSRADVDSYKTLSSDLVKMADEYMKNLTIAKAQDDIDRHEVIVKELRAQAEIYIFEMAKGMAVLQESAGNKTWLLKTYNELCPNATTTTTTTRAPSSSPSASKR